MKSRIYSRILAVFTCSFAACVANAAVVYEQIPSSLSGIGRISSTLNSFGLSPGYTVSDDFRLASDSSITDIHWWAPPSTGGYDFRFTFYADNNGMPGTTLLTSGGSLLSTSTVNFGNINDPVTVYSATLLATFHADANTSYWLSIFNQAPDASWSWLPAGMTGNGAVQGENPGPPWRIDDPEYFPPTDMSFRLIASVPLPSAIVLFASGLMALGWIRRYK